MNRILQENLFGLDLGQHRIGRSLFVKALALVYLIAIASWWSQVTLLVGENGLVPAGELLDWVAARSSKSGSSAFFLLPNVFSWIGTSNFALHFVCWIGFMLGILVLSGRFVGPSLIGLWLVYLSLVNTGGIFMNYQWDILLLEIGFASIFLADWSRKTSWFNPPNLTAINQIALVWLWLILLKLIFFSGWVKLAWASGANPEWWPDRSALDFYYFTQPIPAWTAWSAHHMPGWIHSLSIWLMYLVEIVLPFGILFGRYGRLTAGIGISLLMGLILLTGNYTFFNWLTIAVCFLLIHDRIWPKWIRKMVGYKPSGLLDPTPPKQLAVQLGALSPIFIVIFLLNVHTVRNDFASAPGVSATTASASWLDRFSNSFRTFRLVSGYGLFRTITTERPEIILEGSRDGSEWIEYDFEWKVDDLSDRPKFVAPHQPRVAWQFWFAALEGKFSRTSRNSAWIEALIRKLLEGDRDVISLLKTNPFPDTPPEFIRARLYQYRFTTPEEKKETGDWWTRSLAGEYLRAGGIPKDE